MESGGKVYKKIIPLTTTNNRVTVWLILMQIFFCDSHLAQRGENNHFIPNKSEYTINAPLTSQRALCLHHCTLPAYLVIFPVTPMPYVPCSITLIRGKEMTSLERFCNACGRVGENMTSLWPVHTVSLVCHLLNFLFAII